MRKKVRYNIVGTNTTRAERIIFYIVFISLILSLAFAIIMCIAAPNERDFENPKIKSDYLLMVVQCVAALAVVMLPSMLEHKLKIEIPGFMNILLIIFLYAAVFLGEFRSYYFKYAHWDTMLHTLSGMMLAAASFSVVNMLNDIRKYKLHPVLVALFSFTFALACGVVWEVYEYVWDTFAGFNMQKYALEDGTLLIGQAALSDTMNDLIVDAIGAFVVSVTGFASLKYKKGWMEKMLVVRRGNVTEKGIKSSIVSGTVTANHESISAAGAAASDKSDSESEDIADSCLEYGLNLDALRNIDFAADIACTEVDTDGEDTVTEGEDTVAGEETASDDIPDSND